MEIEKILNPTVSFFYPHPALKNCITKYAFWETDDTHLNKHTIQPTQTGYFDIYLHFNNSEIQFEYRNVNSKHNCMLIGLFDDQLPIINPISKDKCTKWVDISLTYIGLKILLGISGKEANNLIIDVKCIFGNQLNEIIELLHFALNDTTRCKILDRFFMSQIKKLPIYIDNQLSVAFNIIKSSQGKPTINDLAAKLNMSYRTVERFFSNEIGMNVCDYLKLIRMNKAFKLLKETDNIDYGKIITECGYYDQPHFIKDFKSFTGCTPKEFIANKAGSFYFDRPYLILR